MKCLHVERRGQNLEEKIRRFFFFRRKINLFLSHLPFRGFENNLKNSYPSPSESSLGL